MEIKLIVIGIFATIIGILFTTTIIKRIENSLNVMTLMLIDILDCYGRVEHCSAPEWLEDDDDDDDI